jgi:uncharacterized protein YjbI with pentapeptide repeats
VEPKKPALSSKSGSEKKSRPLRLTKRQVLWIIGMVVALLTTALLILNLYPEIWKGLLEERNLKLMVIGVSVTAIIVLLAIGGAASRWTGFRGMTVRDWLDLLVVPLALVVISFLFTTQQDQRQQEIENQRAAAERELAVERAQDEALQAYLAQMSTLMLEKDLRNSEEDSEVRTLARARTLTVLRRVDTSRKDEIMQFLLEAALVHRVGESAPVIELGRADLGDVNLREADLAGANLREANLREAGLRYANLSEANLSNAYLKGADLSEAYGWTDEQIAAANTLEGATMPNGQKYEDWLKHREKRQQDE